MNSLRGSENRTRLIAVWSIALGIMGLVGMFAYWRLRLAHQVNRRFEQIKTAGLPANPAQLDKWYTAVPDAENAALGLTQAFALMRTYPDRRSNDVTGFSFPPRGQSLTTEQKELLTGYIELNSAALAKALEAVKLPRSRYPVDLSKGTETLMPHLRPIRGLAELAREKAAMVSEAGNPAEATSAIILILGLARTLEEEPILISQIARIRLLQTATATLESALAWNPLSGQVLNDLAVAFAIAEKTNLMARALVGERASFVPYFRMSYAQLRRFSKMDDEGTDPRPPWPSSDQKPGVLRLSGFFERDLRLWLETFDGAIRLASLPPPESLAATNYFQRASTNSFKHYCFLSAILLPMFSRLAVTEAESFAHLRLAGIALAVEQFRLTKGRLPENLTDLAPQFLSHLPTDPFDGAPLRFRRLPKGYVIYSVDLDRQDDGGREKPEHKKSGDQASYDLTFTVER